MHGGFTTLNRKVVDVLVGLQWGSEGKGVIAAHMAKHIPYKHLVRVGAPNAGHTFHDDKGFKWVFNTMPCGAVTAPQTKIYIGAGAFIDTDILANELDMLDNAGLLFDEFGDRRVYVDPMATIVRPEHHQEEKDKKMVKKIGSTVHGCGSALVSKIWRLGDCQRWRGSGFDEFFKERVITADTTEILINSAIKGEDIMVEGVQGTLLSIDYGEYPFTTSRNCNVVGMLNECGLSPYFIRDVVGVMRTYPIRVGGNSGSFGKGKELTFEDIQELSGAPNIEPEITTVTKRVRRIATMDHQLLRRSIMLNMPTKIAVTFLDYLDHKDYGVKKFGDLTEGTRNYLMRLESNFGTNIGYAQTSPKDTIDLATTLLNTTKEKEGEYALD